MSYVITSCDLPMKLKNCPPGLFMTLEGVFGFKNEYGDNPFVANSGEYFWGSAKSIEELNEIKVIPVEIIEVAED